MSDYDVTDYSEGEALGRAAIVRRLNDLRDIRAPEDSGYFVIPVDGEGLSLADYDWAVSGAIPFLLKRIDQLSHSPEDRQK